jgi:hypothetical protein
MPQVPPLAEAITSLIPMLKTYGELGGEWLKRRFSSQAPTGTGTPRNVAPEAAAGGTRPASAPNPMVHLSEINAHLTPFERKFLNVLIRGNHGGDVADMLLTMSVDEASAFVKENVARAQAHHATSQSGAARPADVPAVDAPAVDAPAVNAPAVGAPAETEPAPAAPDGSPGFMAHVLAASAHLTAEERATVMWLVPRFPAARLEELKTQLLRMTPRDAATWIREHLPALRAEVSA